MTTTQDVIDTARNYLGVRWVHQGRAAVGLDCAGLVIRVHRDLGLPIEDIEGYRRAAEGHRFLEHIRSQTDMAHMPAPGHMGVFAEATFACHVGLFGERNGVLTLIHAKLSAGKVIEEPFIGTLASNLIEVRAIKGLED